MATQRKRVDLKVIASTVGAVGAGLVLAVLEALVAQPALLEGLSDWARFLVIAAAPGLIVFLSGYAAPPQDDPKRAVTHRGCGCEQGPGGADER